MKFSVTSTVALLAPLVAAYYPPEYCQPDTPSTVTQTIYQTITYNTPPPAHPTPAPLPTPVVTTRNGHVTSCDYGISRTTVWVWPTGSPSHDCTVAIYEKNTVVVVNIVNINIIINNYGQTVTVTSTKTEKPTWTPEPILPPPVTYTQPPYGHNTSTPIYPTSGTGTKHSTAPEYNDNTESSLPPYTTSSPTSSTSPTYTPSDTTSVPSSSSYIIPSSSNKSSVYPSLSSSSTYVAPSSSSKPYQSSSSSSANPTSSYAPPSATPPTPPTITYPTAAIKPSQAPHGARALEWSA